MKNRSVFSLLIVAAMMLAALSTTSAATRLQQKDVDPVVHQVSEVRLDMPIEPPTDLWTNYETASAKSALGQSDYTVLDGDYSVFALDLGRMDAILANVPAEFSTLEKRENYQVTLPMPDGSLQRFRIWDSPIMEAPLAAEYPDVRTYVGQGVDDPTATVRFDRTPLGFHAMIISAGQTVFVDPYAKGDISNYISYDKRGLRRDTARMACLVDDAMQALDRDGGLIRGGDEARVSAYTNGGTLRTYRLAQACTGEYATAVCTNNGVAVTVANTMSQITTTINRVTGIYERELSIRLVLVANNSSIVFTNGSTDPYTNDNPNSLLSQNTTRCNSAIGSANFDIGHVFSTGGGGLAGLGVVCGSRKAEGETGNGDPRGDGFDVDYVAHEMGHQFGGNHTFIGTGSNCSGNGNSGTAYERGSGSTIQAYAGICGTDDLQPHSDDYFHSISLNEMSNYMVGGGACSANTTTGNSLPVLPALTNYTGVPVSTTFTLTAPVATDANGDTLTYAWEDWHTGSACNFRPKAPSTSRSRTFANVANPTSGNTAWEVLPTSATTKTFRCTVRDNRAGGGAYTSATMTVAFVAGAFSVSAPNTAVTWAGNSSQTVTWTKGGSTAANVKISLSTDGGTNYTTVLASTANDGSEAITVPNTPSTTCRIRVEPTDNVYFDDSNVNFTITAGGGCSYSISPTTATAGTAATTGSVSVTAGTGCAWTATSNAAWLTVTSGASGSGNGSVGYSVAVNTGAPRTGTLTIAGQTFTVDQAGASTATPIACGASASGSLATSDGRSNVKGATFYADIYSFTPSASGTATITMDSATFDCWLVLKATETGTTELTHDDDSNGGTNSKITYTVTAGTTYYLEATSFAANAVGAYTLALTCPTATCTFSISPTSASPGAGASTGTVAVTAGTGCAWTVTSNAAWLTITSGASGSGNGSVGYSVAANTDAARTGTMTIAGQTFTVNQASGCTYSISPTSASPAAGATTGTVSVTGGAGCAWTATSNAAWLTITSGASGSGNGSVGYSVAENTGAARSGTLTIAGQTFTVNQAAAASCTYSISPTSASPAAGATTGTVSVTAGAGCAWTATSNAAWLTITSGASGSGNGSVGYSVAANTGAARSGTLTIAGQTFTVNQAAGATCSSSTTAIVSGTPLTQSLATTDCTTTAGNGTATNGYYDTFTFSGTSGQSVTITNNSTAFDAFLRLNNPSGTLVASDDDSNGGTNSKITYTLAATGTFTILATSYAGGSTGSYTVALTISGTTTTVLSEGAESGASGWTVSTNVTGNNWIVSTAGRYTGTNGFRSNQASTAYPNNLDQSLISPAFSLAGKTSASLAFRSKYQTEAAYDYFKVEISTDGGTSWTALTSGSGLNGTSSGWSSTAGLGMVANTYNLNSYVGQANVKIRFRLTSDGSVQKWGVAVDDIAVTAQ